MKIATYNWQMAVWKKAKELNDQAVLYLIQGNGKQCTNMIANDFQCLKNFKSPTTKLWLIYLDMVAVLRKYIHAERTANWALHISTCEQMLPYIVAAGHHKYVSCLPHYIQALKDLPNSVETEFRKGYSVVRQKVGKVNGVLTDMALEMYNRDAKTKLFLAFRRTNPLSTST